MLVEGQGSILHPGYSGVSLGLLHGSLPHALIACHQPSRKTFRHNAWLPIPPLKDVIQLHEAIAAPLRPARTIGVSLNTSDLSDAEARATIDRVANETGLPTTDPVRYDTEAARRRVLAFDNGASRRSSVDGDWLFSEPGSRAARTSRASARRIVAGDVRQARREMPRPRSRARAAATRIVRRPVRRRSTASTTRGSDSARRGARSCRRCGRSPSPARTASVAPARRGTAGTRRIHSVHASGASARRMHSASISADERKSSRLGSHAWQSASAEYHVDRLLAQQIAERRS